MRCAILLSHCAAAALARSRPHSADACQVPTSNCIRGGGSDTIKAFTPAEPESASLGACCAACAATKACVGSQLVTYSSATSCWLMRVQSYKPPQQGVSCNSSLFGPPPPTPPPNRFNRTNFSGVWLQHGDWTDPAMFNASFLVGVDLPIYWSDIEAADGVFNFSSMYVNRTPMTPPVRSRHWTLTHTSDPLPRNTIPNHSEKG